VVLGVVPVSVRRYRAPQQNGEILIDPPTSDLGSLFSANRNSLDGSSITIDGESLSSFRAGAIGETLAAARRYHADAGEPIPSFADGPLLVSGHQPALLHPGVWLKNFALHRLAQKHHLVPVSLIVDTDIVTSTSVRMPVLPLESAYLESVPFDEFAGESTYEDRSIRNLEPFRSFLQRSEAIWKTWGYRPLLESAWPEAIRQSERTRLLGEILAATRRMQERHWGCHNLELPISRMCETISFRRFVRHILADLPRFHATYNGCVQTYRVEHGIRSKNHPVPDLARDGNRYELPFWIIEPGKTKRGRLFAVPGEEMAIGTAIRTRALTTTMFARVCLGVSFIHGIGGGIYDEVTDRIIENWLGITPPGIVVMSGTLRLPLPRFATGLANPGRLIRDLLWNPQRHLSEEVAGKPEVQEKLKRKRDLIESEPKGKRERKEWFQQFQQATRALRQYVEDQVSSAQEALSRHQREQHANEVVMRRDFAWVLFPEEMLRNWLGQKL
jgi:hypothetical protein